MWMEGVALLRLGRPRPAPVRSIMRGLVVLSNHGRGNFVFCGACTASKCFLFKVKTTGGALRLLIATSCLKPGANVNLSHLSSDCLKITMTSPKVSARHWMLRPSAQTSCFICSSHHSLMFVACGLHPLSAGVSLESGANQLESLLLCFWACKTADARSSAPQRAAVSAVINL